MYIGEIIRRYRAETGLSLRAFAQKCEGGITHGYIDALEKGKNPNTGKPSQPSVEKLEAIAHGMDMSLDKLMSLMNYESKPLIAAPEPQSLSSEVIKMIEQAIKNATPYSPGTTMVPVVGSVRCGPGGLAYQELQGSELADVANPQDYFYLRAEGDSMLPDIRPGDFVLVRIQPEVESGELAVVIVDGEEGMLKKYIRKDNAILLQSFNPLYPPRVFVGEDLSTVRVVGRVMEVKRKY